VYKNTPDTITYAQNLNDRNKYVTKGEKILLDLNALITQCLIDKLMVYYDQTGVISVTSTNGGPSIY
jgi:hypothetical protein